MPSSARYRLDIASADVDAHLAHARSFAGGTRGRPATAGGVKHPGRPFIRAATVLLAGAMRGYVEAVVAETGTALRLTLQRSKDLKEQVNRSHGANVHHVHALTASVGLPFVADTIGWKGLPKGGVRQFLCDLSIRCNKIARGSAIEQARVSDVQRWPNLSACCADERDKKCAALVKGRTGTSSW